MENRIRKTLAIYGMLLPAQVKGLLIEVGAEIDRLRVELDAMRSKQP